jgi:sugar (pentulose or hexulose) kinase
MEYVSSLDLGTTSLKGILFDKKGNSIAVDLQEYDLSKPGPDMVEIDCRIYWDSAVKVIKNILHASKINLNDIISIGITSQGENITFLDKDGNPLRPSIVWLDNRTQQEADEISWQSNLDDVYRYYRPAGNRAYLDRYQDSLAA